MRESDEAIVHAVMNGHRESFGTLVERYQHAAVRMAFHLVNDRDAAEDLAQDAFIDAYRGLGKLRYQGKFKSWFFSILHNKCLKHRERRRDETSLDEISAEEWIPADSAPDECDGQLVAMLNRLPIQYREVLALKYLSELSYDEIAQTLGTTVGNVRVRCFRAKEKLRALFESEKSERVC